MLTIHEHVDTSYAPRTWDNAQEGDVTVAFAVDFASAGERLTRKAAGLKHVEIHLNTAFMKDKDAMIAAARTLYRFARAKNARVLNVAGNGIYTLSRHGVTQEMVDVFVATVIAQVHKHHPFTKIISGGQTGVDLAGATAGVFLGVPTQMLLPRSFLQRGVDKIDRRHTHEEIADQVARGVLLLREGIMRYNSSTA